MPQPVERREAESFRSVAVPGGPLADQLRVALSALKRAPMVDDGSLAVRLADQPALIDAILGRDLLDPLELYRPPGWTAWSPDPQRSASSPDDDASAPEAAGADRTALPMAVAALLEVAGPVEIQELDATIDALQEVRARVNALEAFEAVLMERARLQALRAEVLDEEHLLVRNAVGDQRRELARRAVVCEIAAAVNLGEQAVAMRMARAQALCVRAPRTLTAALGGKVGWSSAAHLADAVAELQPATAAALDAAVVSAAGCQNPRVFGRTVRRHRERLHPTPLEVRHQEQATKRGVSIIPAGDGMAYLNLYATAPMVHAVFARVTDTAKHARTTGDPRTLDQLRADVTAALLLDDGTLDTAQPWKQLTLATDTSPDTPSTGDAAPEKSPPSELHAGVADQQDDLLDGSPPASGRYERTIPELATLARSVRPQVFVTVPVLTLLGRSDVPAMLDGTVPVDAETAQALTALAPSLTRLLTHPVSGNVLAVDSRKYLPPAGLRHHLTARDAACRFPGCTRPAMTTDADHTHDYARGGTTTATNLALLCRGHHVLKHQARFRVAQQHDGSGTLTWTTPTGRIYTTTPQPVPATGHTSQPAPIDIPDPADEPPRTDADIEHMPEHLDDYLDYLIATTGSQPAPPIPFQPALRPAWEAPWGDELDELDGTNVDPSIGSDIGSAGTLGSTTVAAKEAAHAAMPEYDWGDPPY